MDQIKRDNM